jgi:hypothetical protein
MTEANQMPPDVLQAHVRGQQISHRELVSESQATLRTCGVGNQLRAEFVSELSQIVRQDNNTLLDHLRPPISSTFNRPPADDHFWSDAYQIAYQYLLDNNLKLTTQAALSECPQSATLGPSIESDQARAMFAALVQPPAQPSDELSLSGSIGGPGRGSPRSSASCSPRKRHPKRRARRHVAEKVETTDSEIIADE